MEAIVLAGGLGTRLQGVIGQYPKCMAEVNGQPFLFSLFEYLDRQKCTRVILSLGYKSRIVTDWLEALDYLPFEVDCVIEDEPLGTGGGILAAIEESEADDVLVVNGDTMFLVDVKEQFKLHTANNAAVTLALKEMHDFDRYGVVNINDKGLITSFEEKQQRKTGLINGGVYIINREAYMSKPHREKFSFEKDYLEAFVGEKKFYGYKSDSYFIDIGIPADFERAQVDFETLFL
jgi:D-glycero-alpha-D-manno-heptose 1-phosphate guanylyltransferase